MKRVLKSASPLSVYSARNQDEVSFSLGNDPHCACDLHVSGPNGMGNEIEIAPDACEALIKIAEAIVGAGMGPAAFRVAWGNEDPTEEIQLNLAEFRAVIHENSFDGRAAYVLSL